MSYHAVKRRKDLKRIVLSERNQSVKAIFCTTQLMTFWKRQNFGDSKKVTEWQVLERMEKWINRAQNIFRAVKLLRMILQWGIHVINICKLGLFNTKMNPNINYRLLIIMLGHCRCIIYNTCVALGPEYGGGCACVGAGGIWEPSVLSAQVFEIKTILANEVYLLK